MKVRESTGEIIFKYSVEKIITFYAIGLNRQKTRVLLGAKNKNYPIIVYFDSETGEIYNMFIIKGFNEYQNFNVACLLGEQNTIYFFLAPNTAPTSSADPHTLNYGILDGSASVIDSNTHKFTGRQGSVINTAIVRPSNPTKILAGGYKHQNLQIYLYRFVITATELQYEHRTNWNDEGF